MDGFDNLADVKVEGGLYKYCRLCQRPRPIGEFYRHRATCKKCCSAKSAAWAKANPKQRNANRRSSYASRSWGTERYVVHGQIAMLQQRCAELTKLINQLRKRS